MKKKLLQASLIAVLGLGLSACGVFSPSPVESFAHDGHGANGAADANGQDEQGHSIGPLVSFNGRNIVSPERVANNTYYFAFDNSNISADDQAAIQQWANVMLQHSNLNAHLAGFTDPLGSREYNVALGERRARSVEQELASDGVPRDRICLVSYGEEKLVTAEDPTMPLQQAIKAYSKDRRVVLTVGPDVCQR